MSEQDREKAAIIQGEEKVLGTVLNFISNADTKVDACIDQTRPALSVVNEQIRELVISSRKKGVILRVITEITITNLHYCKQLLEIVDQLRHLDGIIGSFYVSDKECLVPEIIHKSEKPASQIIYSNVKDTVKQQQYVFETLWNKAVSAQDKIDAIEKGKLPEITEIIRNPAEVRRLAYKLVGSAEKEILLIFASVNAFMRHVSPMSPASSQLLVEAAKYRNVSVKILTPMDETIKKIATDLANQSANIRIRSIDSSSRYTVTVVLVDRKHVTATELKDDSKLDMKEAIGATTYSTSKSIVLSYVSMFENFMRLTELYEESQSRLNDTTDELESIKKYLNEVLQEVDKFRKK